MTVQHTFIILLGLGFYHGINPAMGWLLATAQGLQKKSLGYLVGALAALSVGHLIAVALVVFGYREIQQYIPNIILEWLVAGLLIGFGLYHLMKRGHKAWLGMRSGLAAIALWSFLIATAHGAGIMLLPFIQGTVNGSNAFFFILVHTSGFLIASSFAALLLYSTVNLQLLKNAWINFDLLWAYSLLLTGGFFIFSLLYHRV